MFFVLSKILNFLLKPSIWLLALLLWAVFTRRPQRRRRIVVAALVLFLFFSNQMIFNYTIGWWEVETITAHDILEPYDIGILLGGFSNPNIIPGDDRLNLSVHGNRFFNAYELYRSGKVKRLIISGKSGSLFPQHEGEALHTATALREMGVPDSAILIENRSRNTYENAVFCSEMINALPGQPRVLLITSAYHMRRASGCFRKTRLEFTPYSVDFLFEKFQPSPQFLLLPNAQGLYRWQALIKEWVGYLAYWVQGYL